MSEEVSGDYAVQISGKVHGDLVVVRGQNAEDLANNLHRLADLADEIVTDWSTFKTAAVVKGVFTGDAVGGKTPARTVTPDEDGVPTCKHGPMKDLSDRGYKSTHYCTEKDRDKQCRPVNLR